MRTRLIIPSVLIAVAMLWSGCDSVGVSDDHARLVRPTVSVHFVNSADGSSGKTATLLDVALTVETLSGQDFSPSAVQVDNATQSQVSFDLLLPPDSLYRFRVRFTEEASGDLVGEGEVLQVIGEASTEVDIPVVSVSGAPWLAIIPAVVDLPTSASPLDLTLRYYGDAQPIAGLAARIEVTGPDPVEVEYLGADILEPGPGESQTSLGWQFSEPVSGTNDVGTIRVPQSGSAEFCLQLGEGDTRVVNRDGEIRIIGGSGACIDVNP